MPQNPLIPRAGGNANHLNITATTVIKATPGTVYRVIVNTAPTGAGGVYDVATTGGAAAANLICEIPTGLTAPVIYDLTFPCTTGIVVNPGTGGVVSVSYS